ncbi:MAG: hypothetical protein ACRDSR_13485 [Pseudonocardiaceae bacterium]
MSQGVIGRMVVATSALVLTVGCAGGGSEPAAQLPASVSESPSVVPPDPAQAGSEQTISVRIIGGQVEGVPARVEVARGTRVRIEVTSDRSDELHIHGYEQTVPLAAGRPAVAQLVADQPGVFEVETHDSELLLFQLVVRE